MSSEDQMLDPNPPLPRRKSEATTHVGDGSKPHHHKGVKKREEDLIAARNVQSPKADLGKKGKLGRVCILPMFSQKRILRDWSLEIECWFTNPPIDR